MQRLRSSSPPGARKRRKRSQSLPPAQWYLCQCSECAGCPDVHPETKQLLEGRWVTEKELRIHTANETALWVGKHILQNHLLPSLEQQPSLGLSSEASIDSGSDSESKSSTDTPVSPSRTSQPRSPQREETLSDAAQGAKALAALIKPAEHVLHDIMVVFLSPPNKTRQVDIGHMTNEAIDQLCLLDESCHMNAPIIGYRDILSRARHFIAEHAGLSQSDYNHSPNDGSVHFRLQLSLLSRQVEKEEQALRQLLLEQWQVQDQISRISFSYDSGHHHVKSFLSLSPVTLACFLLVATLYLISGISMDQCTFMLGSLQTILRLALRYSSDLQASFILRSIPNNVRTVIDILEAKPRFESYICCPRCSKLYWVDSDNPDPDYPDTCTNVEVDQPVCGAKLKKRQRRQSATYTVPVRQFRYQSMKEYLSKLYSRPDLKDYLYRDPTQSSGDNTSDIWDAPILHEIIGPDGKTPFIQAPEGEGRLVFSLNMDGFNPYGNRQAGKKVSVGAIYMVCLNLPASIRYDIENVYLVGVIPGPSEPTTHEINYLLKPLVDELEGLWHDGVYLTRTTKYPKGYRVRCALGPLVCDLPAARQMSGFPHFASKNFCSYCTLAHRDIQNLDYGQWSPRKASDHTQSAWAWRNATTKKERERLVLEEGARWSELLRLTYWDPVKFTVIDSMHAFFLRLFQHHCRSIWGMDINFQDGDGIMFDSLKQPSEEEMMIGRNILQHGLKSQLLSLSAAVMRELCRSLSLDSKGTKGDLTKQLVEFRIRQGWFASSGDRLGRSAQEQSFLVNEDLQGTENQIFTQSIIRTIEDVDDYYQNASKPTLLKLRKRDLFSLYLHRIPPNRQQPVTDLKKMSKSAVLSIIQDHRREEGIVDEQGRHINSKRTQTRVLGRDTISEIRNDMMKTSLPSWVPPAPGHPGEKKWGKFSADQWRTFCIQVLPITLIRLWGHKEEGTVERRRLDNFLHLVSAVKLATMRKMTSSRILDYTTEMHKYLTSLVTLYPDVKITPYQHMALHFGTHLERFGPTHAWRCFPFERYNYVMQNIPTNQKFGELEKTMFDRFTSAQSIRVLFKHENIPPLLSPLAHLYTRVFESDIRGTYRSDVMSLDEDFRCVSETVTWTDEQVSSIPSDIYGLLRNLLAERYNISRDTPVSKAAFFRTSISRLGQTFTTKKTSTADSRVIFTSPEHASWSAGSICSIFSHVYSKRDGSQVVSTYAVLKEYQSLSPKQSRHDQFRRYPIVGGRLFRHSYHKSAILVEFAQIKAHFAGYLYSIPQTDISECLLALPLDKE